jgi:hypothetical protein
MTPHNPASLTIASEAFWPVGHLTAATLLTGSSPHTQGYGYQAKGNHSIVLRRRLPA